MDLPTFTEEYICATDSVDLFKEKLTKLGLFGKVQQPLFRTDTTGIYKKQYTSPFVKKYRLLNHKIGNKTIKQYLEQHSDQR